MAWYKYFKESELEPIVVTRHWDKQIKRPEDCYEPSLTKTTSKTEESDGTVIRSPFNPKLRDRLTTKQGFWSSILRKILSLITLLFEHSVTAFDNKHAIYVEAEKLIQRENVDCIIATGEPFVLFSYADKLSRKFNVPWIADYRDGWSTNYNASSGLHKLINDFWLKRIEKSTVKSASLITTAAPAFAKEIAQLFPKKREDIEVVYNGYFEEMHEHVNVDPPLKKRFTIAHAGTVYPFQKLETLIRGLESFKEKSPSAEFELVFYGLKFQPEQIARINQATKELSIRFTDRMPHKEILNELRSCHLLLLLATPEKHQIYAKVFDYLGTGRPILMVENDNGSLEKILESRGNATICSTAEEVCSYLDRVYQNRQELRSVKNQDNTFTRRNQTQKFAKLVHQLIENDKK